MGELEGGYDSPKEFCVEGGISLPPTIFLKNKYFRLERDLDVLEASYNDLCVSPQAKIWTNVCLYIEKRRNFEVYRADSSKLSAPQENFSQNILRRESKFFYLIHTELNVMCVF